MADLTACILNKTAHGMSAARAREMCEKAQAPKKKEDIQFKNRQTVGKVISRVRRSGRKK